MKKSPSKFKGPIYTVLTLLAIIILVAMLLQVKPVTDAVSKATGIAADKIREGAKLVVGIGLGLALVTWGIAALSLPILGGAMILVGLALLAYSVWPLFQSKPAGMEASFDSKSPLSIFN